MRLQLLHLVNGFKSLAPVFEPIGSKTKTNHTLCLQLIFFLPLSKLQVVARNSDWFIMLFAPVVFVWSNNTLVLVFQQSFENQSKTRTSIQVCIIHVEKERIKKLMFRQWY